MAHSNDDHDRGASPSPSLTPPPSRPNSVPASTEPETTLRRPGARRTMKLPKKLLRALFPVKKKASKAKPAAAVARNDGHGPSSSSSGKAAPRGLAPIAEVAPPGEHSDNDGSSTSATRPSSPPMEPAPTSKSAAEEEVPRARIDHELWERRPAIEGPAEVSPVSVAVALAPPPCNANDDKPSPADAAKATANEAAGPPSPARSIYSFAHTHDSPCCSIVEGDLDTLESRPDSPTFGAMSGPVISGVDVCSPSDEYDLLLSHTNRQVADSYGNGGKQGSMCGAAKEAATPAAKDGRHSSPPSLRDTAPTEGCATPRALAYSPDKATQDAVVHVVSPDHAEAKGMQSQTEDDSSQTTAAGEKSVQHAGTQTPTRKAKAKKVTFSKHGEEARQRAIARQRRILAKASLRLDAINDTSVENMQEAVCSPDEAFSRRRSPLEIRKLREMVEASPSNEEDMDVGERILAERNEAGVAALEPAVSPSVSSFVFYQSPGNGRGNYLAADPTQALDARRGQVKDIVAQLEEGPWEENAKASSGQPCDLPTPRVANGTEGEGPRGTAIQFFVLLLCPTSRIFELVELSAEDAPENASTISDVIKLIPEKCTDERLSDETYIGFVRPKDRVDFSNVDARAFGGGWENVAANSIRDGDVLVSILQGYSGQEMRKISRPILNNSKFRDMIRRRSRRAGKRRSDEDRSVRSHRSSRSKKSSGGRSRRRRHRQKAAGGVPTEITADGKPPLQTPPTKGKEYSSLCQKLEDLSKKLNNVDDEMMVDDNDDGAQEEDGAESVEEVATPHLKGLEASAFKMTPKMVAYELASNIEDIFADHDVEIVAVDAVAEDDDTFVSDDDTFVSARSSRSLKSLRSVRSLVKSFEVKVEESKVKAEEEKEARKKERQQRRSKFDQYGEDDMMLQIEAMAAQADAAFESRKMTGAAIIEANIDSITAGPEIEVLEEKNTPIFSSVEVIDEKVGDVSMMVEEDADEMASAVGDIDEEASKARSLSFDEEIEVTPENVLTAIRSIKKKESDGNAIENCTEEQKNALSRNFLNTSTSMVSTMVAASQGRVNEVHVLQYLGVTIVCIAANFMQQGARKNVSPGLGGGPNLFGAKEVLQSAMFLAFMVNGQRYLAKVTKK